VLVFFFVRCVQVVAAASSIFSQIWSGSRGRRRKGLGMGREGREVKLEEGGNKRHGRGEVAVDKETTSTAF